MTITNKVMAILLNICWLKWYFKIKFKWSYLKGRSIESAKFWCEKVSLQSPCLCQISWKSRTVGIFFVCCWFGMEWPYGGNWLLNIKRLHVPGPMVVSFPAYVPVSANKNILGLAYRVAVLEHHRSPSRNTNYCSTKVAFLCRWSLIHIVLYLETFIV